MENQICVSSEAPAQTFGQKAVGLSFNPSSLPEVDAIKHAFAAVIDVMNDLRTKASEAGNSGAARHYSVAITEAESAQMRGVKAATWKE